MAAVESGWRLSGSVGAHVHARDGKRNRVGEDYFMASSHKEDDCDAVDLGATREVGGLSGQVGMFGAAGEGASLVRSDNCLRSGCRFEGVSIGRCAGGWQVIDCEGVHDGGQGQVE